MLFERQRLLLTLLNSVGAPVLHAAFQNLLFLYTRECEATPSYDFVPAGSGAFSFTACADKEKLIEKGLLAEDDENWALTKAGGAVARREAVEQPRVAKFLRKYSRPRGQALILEESRLEREALARVAAAKPTRQPAGLLTIGYEGRSLESYLNELLRAGVTLLCDVRGNPFSRKYGFSKSTLSKACEAVGIRYEHLPELGGRRRIRTYERGVERETLACGSGAIAAAAVLVREGVRPPIVLTPPSGVDLTVELGSGVEGASRTPVFRLTGEARIIFEGVLAPHPVLESGRP